MSTPAVSVRALTKRYPLGHVEKYPTIRDAITKGASNSMRWLKSWLGREAASADSPHKWALQGIDLEIAEGEVFGIIGRNGSGKSTLLKILSGIAEPTSGYADITGRVGSLLEVGTGFHMELTGRENIALNGALLGMRRVEIQRKFDEIVAFSEVEEFLDTPVKRYSSGMFMRLAFAVAAHLEPDILIVDEVLAVGDLAFQRKCLGKMSTVASEGRTVIFVSHHMPSVQSLCTRAALLENGKVAEVGSAETIIGAYLRTVTGSDIVPLEQRLDRRGDGSVRMTSIDVRSLDRDGIVRCSSRLVVTLRYRSDRPVRFPAVSIGVVTSNEVWAFVLESDITGGLPDTLPAEGAVRCITAPMNLTPGRCFITLRFKRGGVDADIVSRVMEFDIESDDFYGTGKMPERQWSLFLLHQDWTVLD